MKLFLQTCCFPPLFFFFFLISVLRLLLLLQLLVSGQAKVLEITKQCVDLFPSSWCNYSFYFSFALSDPER